MLKDELQIEPAAVCEAIEKFIRDKVDELHRDGAILGLSGGIDSSVVAYLASRALGAKNVLCLLLPDKHSSKAGQRHARIVLERLGVEFHEEDLTPKLNKFGFYRLVPGRTPASLVKSVFGYTKKPGEPLFSTSGSKNLVTAKANAFYRIKHRMRMLILYYHAEKRNLMVTGAANKTELSIGFFVEHGCDDAADIMPILGLYKTQVRQLAKYLGVPQEIIDSPPSPDLIPGITDEYAIGLSYETLDLILHGLERGLPHEQIALQLECDPEIVEYVRGLTEKSRYKREIPYVPDLQLS